MKERLNVRDVLFLTNFSDACFRSTRAVAQLVDELGARLTILYAYDPQHETKRATMEKLQSFFPEADHFRGTRRVLAEGDLLTAVAGERRKGIDYVLAPVPVRFGLPRFAHRSIRASLLVDQRTQVWTIGEKTAPVKLGIPARNVACLFDAQSPDNHHLRRASDYATSVGARMHLLHVIPDINEGALNEPRMPLNEGEVAALAPVVARRDRTEIHVVPGGGRRAIVDLLRSCDADLLFLNERQAVRWSPFGTSMSGIVHHAPCPTMCVTQRMYA